MERGERVGQNEAIFRNVNEQIEGINKALSELTQTMDVVCECGNITCMERIMVTVPAYERVRAESTLFIVLPGHEMLDIEEVVGDHDSYRVVRKDDPAAREVVEETDPRS
jgi:recombinational DNA repair protein RecR